MNIIINRADALASNQTHYFTGKPCRDGHTAPRYVSTGNCTQCQKERSASVASLMRKGKVSRIQGHFSYPLHADDFAAALAYCQALDMQRGIRPKTPKAEPKLATLTTEQLLQRRNDIFKTDASLGVAHTPTMR